MLVDDKALKNNIKKGWTVEDFAEYCGVSADEFEEYLKRKFSDKYLETIWRDLKRNAKNRKKVQRNAFNKGARQKSKSESVLTDEQNLQDLEKQEENIRKALEQQLEHCQRLQKTKGECQDRLRRQKEFLEQLCKQVSESKDLMMNLGSEIAQFERKIIGIENLGKELQQKLLQIQSKKKLFETVKVICYEDGRVESEEEWNLNWEPKFQALISGDYQDEFVCLIEDLPIKEIKQVAKILTLMEELTERKRKFQIFFEKETQVSALLDLVDIEVEVLR